MQLARILQSQGFGSRRECRALVETGRVAVDGSPCRDPEREFKPEALTLTVDGVDWRARERVCVAMNKPAGYECSRQPRDHPSVYALLPEPLARRGAECVGRLDQDTTGLLLFTDDGALAHRLISPRKRVGKVYRATCRHPVTADMVEALLAGVKLRDDPEPARALACTRIDDRVLELTLAEGKYHQVKRMLAAAGNRVEALHRLAIGGYALPADLEPGRWRFLEADELARLETSDR